MSSLQRAHILSLIALAVFLVIPPGWGASSGGSETKTQTSAPGYDQRRYIAAYQQAIGGFQAASNQNRVQALMFQVLTPSDANYTDFIDNILPHISGVSISMPWNHIETSQGQYDGFTSFDAKLQPYLRAGKQVNLIVWPATEGGDNDPNDGGSTPAYVFSQAWATTVGAPKPQDMTVCKSYTGDAENPFHSAVTNGGGGAWNVNSNVSNASDLSGLPVSYETPFMVAYQNFIAHVIAHYNAPGAPKIGYIRFGLSQGGENSPECNQYWPKYSKNTYLSYVQTMTNFVHAQNPSVTILEDLHTVGAPTSPDEAYAEAEAADAVPFGFGISTNGLQQSDITNFAAGLPCDSDWCNLFSEYPGRTLSLQTLQWSDPTGVEQTGSLAVIVPFAQQHGANNLELYLADLALAFSPNYCSYQHAVC
jgi:hypothetical protein